MISQDQKMAGHTTVRYQIWNCFILALVAKKHQYLVFAAETIKLFKYLGKFIGRSPFIYLLHKHYKYRTWEILPVYSLYYTLSF